MSDLITTKSGEPYKTTAAAEAKKTAFKKEGKLTEVVPVDGGYALREVAVRRKKKGELGRRNVLTLDNKDPNFEYRFFNDDPDNPRRLQGAEAEDWEIDTDQHAVGDDRIDGVQKPGAQTRIPVNDKLSMVLMKKRKEWYDDDQREKQEAMDEVERMQIRENEAQGLKQTH